MLASAPGPSVPGAREGHDPRPGEVASRFVRRAVLPGLLVAFLLYGVGWVIKNPLGGLPAEEGIGKAFTDGRNPLMDSVTRVWSMSTDTFVAIGLGIAFSLLVWALSRRWWLGLAPISALALESSIFVPVTNLVGRDRPLVPHLDAAPPTSSYPSGHTAAAFALYLVLALLASRIPWRPVRLVVQVVCVVWPFLVAWARLYRGMHHLSDVLIGALLGVWCAWAVRQSLLSWPDPEAQPSPKAQTPTASST